MEVYFGKGAEVRGLQILDLRFAIWRAAFATLVVILRCKKPPKYSES